MDIITIIQTLGIPTGAFLLAFAGMKYVYDKESEQAKEVTDKITTLADAVYENTKILTVLVEEVKEKNNE